MPRNLVPCSLAFVLGLAGGTLLAQERVQAAPPSAEQVQAEIKRLGIEIDNLRRSPQAPREWKQRQEIAAALAAMHEKRRQEQAPLQAKYEELSQSQPVRGREEEISQQERRLRALKDLDYQQTREAGRQLFQARHAELARIAPAQTPQLRQLGLDVLSYPRMDGSTSTQPLATLIACRCFEAGYEWVGRDQALPRQSRYDSTLPIRDLERFMERPWFRSEPELKLLEFTLRARTEPSDDRLGLIINALLAANASTHQAYVNLIEGRSDIGLLARPPSADERQLAREKAVELEIVPCARDAFVFLVHQKNPVKGLTTPQIREIYSGQVQDWQSVGGPKQKITAYQREENSGSQELMRTLVMKNVPLAKPTGQFQAAPQLVGQLMSSTFLSLSRDESGIGYSVYYYENFMSGSPRTRTIAVDGVVPTYDTIRDRTYPLISDVYVVTRAKLDAQSQARRMRDWLLSAEGQAVVRESGYVPVTSPIER